MFENFVAEAFRIRAAAVEDRIRRLLDAGVPMEKLTLLHDKRCISCGGSGAIWRREGRDLVPDECKMCLGVAIIE